MRHNWNRHASMLPNVSSSGMDASEPRALYVGNMMSGMLSRQQHLGPLLASEARLPGIEAATAEVSSQTFSLSLFARFEHLSMFIQHRHKPYPFWHTSGLLWCWWCSTTMGLYGSNEWHCQNCTGRWCGANDPCFLPSHH